MNDAIRKAGKLRPSLSSECSLLMMAKAGQNPPVNHNQHNPDGGASRPNSVSYVGTPKITMTPPKPIRMPMALRVLSFVIFRLRCSRAFCAQSRLSGPHQYHRCRTRLASTCKPSAMLRLTHKRTGSFRSFCQRRTNSTNVIVWPLPGFLRPVLHLV